MVDLFLRVLLSVYLLINNKLFNKKICYKIKAKKNIPMQASYFLERQFPLFLCCLSHESICIIMVLTLRRGFCCAVATTSCLQWQIMMFIYQRRFWLPAWGS